MAFIVGKDSSVLVGGTAFPMSKWKMSFKTILPKITNSTSGGAQALLSGIYSATISVTGPYSDGAVPVTSGVSYVFTMKFTNAVTLTVPVILETIDSDNDIEGNPVTTLTGQSSGTFSPAIA